MDTLIKYMLEDCVSVTVCSTKELCEVARTTHNTYPTCTAALGRVLTGAVLMGSTMKNEEDRLTISMNGGGPAGTVLATVDCQCRVKGYIENPCVDLPSKNGKLDVGGAIGKDGFVCVARDTGKGEPYVGRTPIHSGEVAEDIAHYYLSSEQQPSIVCLGVMVETDCTVLRAGGILIRPLPNAEEAVLSAIEERLQSISNYVIMLMAMTPEEAADRIFSGMKLEKLGEHRPVFECDCSRERLEEVLITLGAEELTKLIEEDGAAELTCRFCNGVYAFDRDELTRLRDDALSKT